MVLDERKILMYGKNIISAFLKKIWPSKIGLYQNYAQNGLSGSERVKSQ